MAIKRDDMVQENAAFNDYGDGVAWIRGPMLGKGSFGRVYKATLKNHRYSKYSCFPTEMAVKSADVSFSGTLQKESEIMSSLGANPYVIQCFGDETTMGDNGALAYNLLLEYASGGTLADRIKKSGGNGLPELEARVHTRSILRGLNYIHGLGYVHCDLKPDNILLVAESGQGGEVELTAKIGDFGLAKGGRQSNKKRKLSEPCSLRGTPMYLSPEAVIDSVQEAPCDVWAVGCIVLKMLTGKPPWDGTNGAEILAKIGTEQGLPEIPNWISKDARDFLDCCFQRKSGYRLTAELLLEHPFLEDLDKSSDDEFSGDSFSDDESEEDSNSSCCEEDGDKTNSERECSSGEEEEIISVGVQQYPVSTVTNIRAVKLMRLIVR